MAYSWPSHCKRYLEAVDAEKRFIRSCQVRGLAPGKEGCLALGTALDMATTWS